MANLSIFTELEITQDLKVSNDLEITQNIEVDGDIILKGSNSILNLKTIKSNRLTTSDPCGNYVDISGSALLLPRGPYESRMSTTNDGSATAKAGMIMYDTSQNQFVGVIDTANQGSSPNLVWTGLGGVISIDQTTKITATNVTSNDGLRFYTNDNFNMYINKAGSIFLGDIQESWASEAISQFVYHKTSDPIFMISRGDNVNNRNNGIKFQLQNDNNARIFNTYTAGKLSLGAGGDSERIIIDTNGNVGIGTTAPRAKLQVSGHLLCGGDFTNFTNVTQSLVVKGQAGIAYDGIYLVNKNNVAKCFSGFNETTDAWYMQGWFGEVENIRLHTNGNSYFNGGNVGIGTDSPSKKLEISGTDYQFGIKNSTNNDVWGLTNLSNNLYFQYNNSNKMVLKSNGNVGIGTDSPKSILNIYTANPELIIQDTDTSSVSADASLIFAESGTSGAVGHNYRIRYNHRDLIFSEGDSPNNTTEVMRFYESSSGGAVNVGIGTTSPGEKLEVSGRIKISGGTYIDSNQIRNDTGIFYINNNNGKDVSICTFGGNVGIGTNEPDEKLEINGWIGRSDHNVGGLCGSYNNVSGNGDKTNPIYIIGSNFKPEKTTLMNASQNNMYGIGFSYANSASFITGTANGWGLYVASDGHARTFLSAGDDGKSYINKDGGCLGIGTDSPKSTLEIKRGSGLTGNALYNEDRYALILYSDDYSGGTDATSNGVFAVSHTNRSAYMTMNYQGLYKRGSGRMEIFNRTNNEIQFGTSNIERMRIDSVGRLLVGTTSNPTYGYSATFAPIGTTTNNHAGISIMRTTNDYMYMRMNTSGGEFVMQTYLNSLNTGKICLQPYGGKVGIGTTSVDEKLHVEGSIKVDNPGIIWLGTYIKHLPTSENTYMGFPQANTITFGTNGAERMRIDSAGNVGIGTTSPDCSLDIRAPDNGTAKIMLCGSGSGTGDLFLGQSEVYGGGIIYNGDGYPSTGTTTDAISFYRMLSDGAHIEVFYYELGSSTVKFKSDITSAGDITAYYSDERLKTFKGKITEPIEKINKLNGYYFVENELAKSLGYNNDKLQVGVSAQEVEKVLPEIVTDAPIDKKYKTIWYEKLTPLLIEGIKAQQTQIQSLQSQIDELKELIQNKL